MSKNKNISKFFLGANTPGGFFSRFDNLYTPDKDWFCYIIKGGPGTGKSGLMKKIAKAAENRNIKTELIYCSSDPGSLDAVIFPEKKICIADGTSPHSIDPVYPGESDTIISLSDWWDSNKLYDSRENIINLSKKNSNYHLRSRLYLQAYGNIYKDTLKIIQDGIDKDKIKSYSKRLSKKILKEKQNRLGKEKIYFISGITPDGVIIFEDTINNYEHIYTIEDEYGIVSSFILQDIRYFAMEHGYDIITCFCPIDPQNKVECVLIPDLDFVFASSNSLHPLNSVKYEQKINAHRFFDSKKIQENKQKIRFNKKILNELLKESISNLSKAKSVHDKLEEEYIKSMNFEKVDKLADDIINKIF